ncbi:MAG: hypothetical protein AB8F78_05100 [Saprospiraceae bacterium]
MLELGQYGAEGADLLWLASADAALRARNVEGYETIDKFGTNASNVRAGIFERIDGIDVFKSRYIGNAVADDGLVSGTPADNTNSIMQLLYAPSVQYAMGHDPVIVAVERAG